MAIYCKKINGQQRAWLQKYEQETGFEPMYQEDIDAGTMTFHEAAWKNITWYEDHTNDTYLRISHNVPGRPTP